MFWFYSLYLGVTFCTRGVKYDGNRWKKVKEGGELGRNWKALEIVPILAYGTIYSAFFGLLVTDES